MNDINDTKKDFLDQIVVDREILNIENITTTNIEELYEVCKIEQKIKTRLEKEKEQNII